MSDTKFKRGNTCWRNRTKNGKPKAIETPQKLWELFCGYAQSVDDNPYHKITTKEKKNGNRIYIETTTEILIRPYTWKGFERHLFGNKIKVRLSNYKSNRNGAYADYVYIIGHISKIIYDNKYCGALIGIFNARIIARELGKATIKRKN